MSLRKFAITFLVLGLAIACAAQQAKRGTAEATINGKKVSISYGRPSLQGRDMLAQATPGTVWRVGMNGSRRRLTSPPAGFADESPRLSSDGRSIFFPRSHQKLLYVPVSPGRGGAS